MSANRNKGYYRGERQEMLSFIPMDAKTVLEIGCGSGGFACQLKQREGIREVWGCEPFNDAAEEAKKVLDHVLTGSIEVHIDMLPNDFFDCIVFNDSLEHLVDPFSVLDKMKSKLNCNGVICASIPNVRHYKNLNNLIFKKQWCYESAGILDRTHLRFFTRASIEDMFVEQGYRLELIEGINSTRKFKVKLLQLLSFGILSDINFLQFACVARKYE